VTPESFQANGSAPEPALGLNQGQYGVRLTGQDVERGTFNQRHAALFDQVTGERCCSAHCLSHTCICG
jgi:2-oxoglutarate dehydrogenase E1 component